MTLAVDWGVKHQFKQTSEIEENVLTLKGVCFTISPSVALIDNAVITHVIDLFGGVT